MNLQYMYDQKSLLKDFAARCAGVCQTMLSSHLSCRYNFETLTSVYLGTVPR